MVQLARATVPWRTICPARRLFSSSLSRPRHVPLAYNLHQPPGGAQDLEAPIIFMHGLFGSKQNNRSMSKVLARDLGRSIFAIDLRNHGDSSHDDRHDYMAMAEDVEAFIYQHKLKQASLIGHSMGAKVAMTLALKSSSLVESLISVDNAPVDAALKSDFPKYVQGMKKIEDLGIKKQSEADDILKEYENSLPVRQFLLTNLIRSRDTGLLKFRIPLKILGAALDNMGDFPFKDPEDVRFEKPALFIRGTRSHYVADESLPIIGRFFPRFELRDVESGHWVISENPEGFRKAVVEFFQKND